VSILKNLHQENHKTYCRLPNGPMRLVFNR